MRSFAAFEKSEYADDWRELMRLYMVRRTRSFIQENYAKTRYRQRIESILSLPMAHGRIFRTAFPKTVKFKIDRQGPQRPVCPPISPTMS